MTGEKIETTATILNQKGLHARASAKFVATVARYQAEVTVTKGDNVVSGRSIMGLMMLGASKGSMIGLSAEGVDADGVIRALRDLIDAKFHEDA